MLDFNEFFTHQRIMNLQRYHYRSTRSVGGKKRPLYILWFAYAWMKRPQQLLTLTTCVVDSKVSQWVVNSACGFDILLDALGLLPCENLFLVYGFSAFAHTLIKWYSLIGENLKQHCNTFEYKCFLIIYLDMLLGIGIPCTYVTVTNSQHLIHVSTYFTTPITLSVGQQLRHSASSV